LVKSVSLVIAYAVESAVDELARQLGIDPIRMRHKNMAQAQAGDALRSIWPGAHDTEIGGYGLDQCLDFIEQALASGPREKKAGR
jgi:CO/xanthine dehydrogenase Mo-binding subunit